MPETRPPEECAQCGAAIPRNARACPECGADERTGWMETSIYDGLDLPDSAWSERESEGQRRDDVRRFNGVAWYWWLVGVALVALLFLGVSGLR